MGKVKRPKRLPENSNLNRFKNYVNQFTSENDDRFPEHGKALGVKKELSRKEQRKAERKFKKFKKHAFKQKIPIPTKESIEKEKKEKEAEKEKKKLTEKKERKKKQKKRVKKQRQEKKKEEEEARKRSLFEANKYEDREIKKYEKLLRLNKRKSKTISLGFRNEGLDFLLEAVDKEKLKQLMETGEELESAEMALGLGHDSGSDQEDSASDKDDWGSDQENTGSDDDSDEEGDPNTMDGFNMDSDNLQLEVGSQSGSDGDGDKNKKGLMVDEIMNSLISGKKVKSVKDGKRKTVTFNDDIVDEESVVKKKKMKGSVDSVEGMNSSFEKEIKERLSKNKQQKVTGNFLAEEKASKKKESVDSVVEGMNYSFEKEIKKGLSQMKQQGTDSSSEEEIIVKKMKKESCEGANSSFENVIKERLSKKKLKETGNVLEKDSQFEEINSSFEREIKSRLSKKKPKESGNAVEERDSSPEMDKNKKNPRAEEMNASFENEIKDRLSKKKQKETGNVSESHSPAKKDKSKRSSQLEEVNSSFEREIKQRLLKKNNSEEKKSKDNSDDFPQYDSNEDIYEPEASNDESGDNTSEDMSDNENDEVAAVTGESDEENMNSENEEASSSEPEELIDDEDNGDESQSEDEGPKYKEDIYGRLRDEEGNIIDSKTLKPLTGSKSSTGGAYIPPGKRLAMAGTMDEKKRIEIERMKKQLKGLINRLSENNMQSVAGQIEEMFRSHSRAETCEALTEIIMGAFSSSFLVPERLMMEHCMLIAILHGNVGSEVGANFLQYFAQKFKSMFSTDDYQTGKEMDNVVMLLANLYNFKVVHSLLLFDVMRKFAEKFGERDIEILLLILKNVGFSLRKDDPAALKDFIVQIQNKASTVDTATFQEKTKVQFMLEIILHIKNNNMRKIPNYDPSHLDHLKKLLRNYIKGSSSADFQLRISLEDLLQAEQQGKWWIVGSAWSGRDHTSLANTTASMASVGKVSAKILELARKQRMNTDVRKNIFCVIMTAEDFVDAFEKLLRLGFKHQQEREIIHVIVDLCLQEKTFNPFYAYLLQKFCEYDRRFQMTLQFNVWDKFKESNSLGDQRLDNLSKALTHLIATKAMSLSVFKVLEFSELDKNRVRIMKKTLSAILLEYDEHITKETFSRIAPLQKLQTLREGLKLFMSHFLLKKKKKDGASLETKNELLTERVGMAEKALNSGESQFKM